MKKIFLISFVLFSLIAKAQLGEINQRLLQGNISFSANKSKGMSAPTNLAVGFNYGKFYKKNILTIYGVTFNHSQYPNYSKFFGTSLSYGKIFYKKLFEKFYIGIGGNLSAGYLYEKSIQTITTTYNNYSLNCTLYPTASYQISNRFLVNLSLNNFVNLAYRYQETKPTGSTNYASHNFNLSSGLFTSTLDNIQFGFSYLLKQKK